jgi:hypothetical protein
VGKFERVTRKEFVGAIADGRASSDFRRAFPKYKDMVDLDLASGYYVHRGTLRCSKNFRAPGAFTVVVGDLHVKGLLDLANPVAAESDLPSVFVVLGSVTCAAFANDYWKLAFIDGTLDAQHLVLTAFEDSALLVYGDLRTKFLYARDVAPCVGGAIKVDFGVGGCQRMIVTPRGPKFTTFVRPRRGEAASWSMLSPTLPDLNGSEVLFLARLRAGRSVFRRRG